MGKLIRDKPWGNVKIYQSRRSLETSLLSSWKESFSLVSLEDSMCLLARSLFRISWTRMEEM